jgi:hypothetical protein
MCIVPNFYYFKYISFPNVQNKILRVKIITVSDPNNQYRLPEFAVRNYIFCFQYSYRGENCLNVERNVDQHETAYRWLGLKWVRFSKTFGKCYVSKVTSEQQLRGKAKRRTGGVSRKEKFFIAEFIFA